MTSSPERTPPTRERVRTALVHVLYRADSIEGWTRLAALLGAAPVDYDEEDALYMAVGRIADALLAVREGPRELLEERYWCGCIRFARWHRCERHPDLEHDEEPRTLREEEERAERLTTLRASSSGPREDGTLMVYKRFCASCRHAHHLHLAEKQCDAGGCECVEFRAGAIETVPLHPNVAASPLVPPTQEGK